MTATSRANDRENLPSTSRYEVLVKIAAGGMATVYVGRSRARGGITRLFAIKRAHPHLLENPEFRRMFVDEARLASRIHHPNVVAVQDVEELDDEILLVLDYVEGAALANLRDGLRKTEPKTRIGVACRVVLDACAGLHAAHELRDDDDRPLNLVHRDISPHNMLVGVDGIARLTDFGIAKSAAQPGIGTATGGLKGKIPYMAPEYIETGKLDRRADVFGLGVVLWEAITGMRLFEGNSEIDTLRVVSQCVVRPPSLIVREVPRELDEVVLTALARSQTARFPDAAAFGEALERATRAAGLLASHRTIGALVQEEARETLAARRATIRSGMDRGIAYDDTESASSDLPSDYQGHDRTSTFGGQGGRGASRVITGSGVSGEQRAPTAGSVTLMSSETLSDPSARRTSGLVMASIAMLVVALGLIGWAGAKRLSRAPDVSTTTVATPAATPVVTALPIATATATTTTIIAADAGAAASVDSAVPPTEPSTAPRSSPVRPRPVAPPATTPAAPFRAPKNPYRDGTPTDRP